jgi:hypothetical protein
MRWMWLSVLVGLSVSVWELSLEFLDPRTAERYLPSASNCALFFCCLLLSTFVRNSLSRFFCLAWTGWSVIGNLFIFGQSLQGKLLAPLFVQRANDVYLIAVACLILGVLAQQALAGRAVFHEIRKKIAFRSPVVSVALIVFPLAYAISLYSSGAPTILSGQNILDQMYVANHGALYGLRVVLPLSIVFIAIKYPQLPTATRVATSIYGAFVLFLCVVDGKRDMALISVLALLVQFIGSKRRISVGVFATIVVGVSAYAIISDIRAGEFGAGTAWALRITTLAGVEYKDYVYSINYFSPEYIRGFGFDFVRSTVASILNRSALAVFGINKDNWLDMDSAQTWMRAYGISFGIRTGLVCELYFAFGWLVYPIMAGVGVGVGMLAKAIRNARTELSYLVLLILYADIFTALVGQATAVVGTATSLAYCFVAFRAFEIFWVARRNNLRGPFVH